MTNINPYPQNKKRNRFRRILPKNDTSLFAEVLYRLITRREKGKQGGWGRQEEGHDISSPRPNTTPFLVAPSDTAAVVHHLPQDRSSNFLPHPRDFKMNFCQRSPEFQTSLSKCEGGVKN
ncbi:hypothetical protein CEXT_512151 [Caerostris extrusa]|uniref:Uncharacterized protein n=1 Tax=Caerostris extrusa TaxID=172846 RepID=A0AAV4M7P1_CAEEX|nr:hypothetical protein CEXT_512151 [Caerostris extrusa]